MSEVVGFLEVTVVSAQNLLREDGLRGGPSDPYVKFHFGGKKYKTKVIKNNCNPTWNETFTFPVKNPDAVLDFIVMDKDLFKNDLLGNVKVPISDFVTFKEARLTEYFDVTTQGKLLLKTHWTFNRAKQTFYYLMGRFFDYWREVGRSVSAEEIVGIPRWQFLLEKGELSDMIAKSFSSSLEIDQLCLGIQKLIDIIALRKEKQNADNDSWALKEFDDAGDYDDILNEMESLPFLDSERDPQVDEPKISEVPRKKQMDHMALPRKKSAPPTFDEEELKQAVQELGLDDFSEEEMHAIFDYATELDQNIYMDGIQTEDSAKAAASAIFNTGIGVLNITIISAKDVQEISTFQQRAPYVKLIYSGKRYKTKPESSMEWNDTFSIIVQDPSEKLEFQVSYPTNVVGDTGFDEAVTIGKVALAGDIFLHGGEQAKYTFNLKPQGKLTLISKSWKLEQNSLNKYVERIRGASIEQAPIEQDAALREHFREGVDEFFKVWANVERHVTEDEIFTLPRWRFLSDKDADVEELIMLRFQPKLEVDELRKCINRLKEISNIRYEQALLEEQGYEAWYDSEENLELAQQRSFASVEESFVDELNADGGMQAAEVDSMIIGGEKLPYADIDEKGDLKPESSGTEEEFRAGMKAFFKAWAMVERNVTEEEIGGLSRWKFLSQKNGEVSDMIMKEFEPNLEVNELRLCTERLKEISELRYEQALMEEQYEEDVESIIPEVSNDEKEKSTEAASLKMQINVTDVVKEKTNAKEELNAKPIDNQIQGKLQDMLHEKEKNAPASTTVKQMKSNVVKFDVKRILQKRKAAELLINAHKKPGVFDSYRAEGASYEQIFSKAKEEAQLESRLAMKRMQASKTPDRTNGELDTLTYNYESIKSLPQIASKWRESQRSESEPKYVANSGWRSANISQSEPRSNLIGGSQLPPESSYMKALNARYTPAFAKKAISKKPSTSSPMNFKGAAFKATQSKQKANASKSRPHPYRSLFSSRTKPTTQEVNPPESTSPLERDAVTDVTKDTEEVKRFITSGSINFKTIGFNALPIQKSHRSRSQPHQDLAMIRADKAKVQSTSPTYKEAAKIETTSAPRTDSADASNIAAINGIFSWRAMNHSNAGTKPARVMSSSLPAKGHWGAYGGGKIEDSRLVTSRKQPAAMTKKQVINPRRSGSQVTWEDQKIKEEMNVTKLRRELNQRNMVISQKDRKIKDLEEKVDQEYLALDGAYQKIMELEERLKSLSQENNRLRHNQDLGDSSIDFSRAPDSSDFYSE